MRSFQFRLDRVLEWRRNQHQMEQARLGECMTALDRAQQRFAEFQAERLSVERDVISRREIAACDFPALGLYRLRARKIDLELNGELRKSESAVQDQMQRVQDAQRRVRLLEKLRERRLAEHRYLEDKELEDLAAEVFLAKWERSAVP